VDTVRIGIIGVGHMARMHHIPCLQRLGGNRLVATCDIRADRVLPGLNGYTDVREMLAKEALDAVYVLTPPGTHVEPVCLALERGCHVFCEMPPAVEPFDAIHMASFAREMQRSLVFGTNRHFAPTYQEIKRIANSEPPTVTVFAKCRHALTDLTPDFAHSIDAHYAERYTEDGTPMFLFLTQFLEVSEWLNGPIADCKATSTAFKPGMRTKTHTVAQIKHENGARSLISYDEFGPNVFEHVTVHACASTYIVRGSIAQPNELLIWTDAGQEVIPAPADPQVRSGYMAQANDFLRCLRENILVYPDSNQLARIIKYARKIDGSSWWKQHAPVVKG